MEEWNGELDPACIDRDSGPQFFDRAVVRCRGDDLQCEGVGIGERGDLEVMWDDRMPIAMLLAVGPTDVLVSHGFRDVLDTVARDLAASLAWWRELSLPSRELYAAACTDDLARARGALAAGASMDPPNSSGPTPLTVAASAHSTHVGLELLGVGAQPDRPSGASALTPLYYAVRNADCDLVRALLARGAAVDARDPWGTTALHHYLSNARYPPNFEMVRHLVRAGADVRGIEKLLPRGDAAALLREADALRARTPK